MNTSMDTDAAITMKTIKRNGGIIILSFICSELLGDRYPGYLSK